MKCKLNKFFNEISIKDYGYFLFITGIFFLPSTIFVGLIFLLPALIIGTIFRNTPYFQDKWNYPFLILGIFILVSTFLQNYVFINRYEEIWDPTSSIIGMGNWLPLIWCFWASQPYLNSHKRRKLFSLILIAATVPILITGFGQYFFDWIGPFKTLNGLITWYLKPIENPGGITGLFSNQNYTGSWLNLIWPFCMALFLEKGKDIFRRIMSLSFLFSVGFAAFLTYSRNAWIGLLTSIPIVLGKKGITIFLPILITLIFFLFFLISPLFNGELQTNIRTLIPEKISLEFNQEGYIGLNVSRTTIFLSAINLIKSSPFFGIGASAFTPIFLLETSFWKGHSHNLILELSISYGLPSAIIFFITIFIILFLSWKKIFLNNNEKDISFFDRAYWAALFFFMISQLVDIQYFDGRISIVIWMLVASLKNIIEEDNIEKFS